MLVTNPGWQRVTQPELVAAGLDPNASPLMLKLWANGQQVPIKVSGNQIRFTSSDYIEFYGRGLDSPTDAGQTYYLIPGKTPGIRIGNTVANKAAIQPPSGAQSYQYTIQRKDRWIYYSAYLNGDEENVFGHIVRSTPVSETLPVNHHDAAGGEAKLEISLAGVSLESHHVRVTFNRTDVGTIDFDGAQHPSQTFNVPAALLQDGDNTVQLTAFGSSTDTSLVDTMRLTYAHTYVADDNVLSVEINSQQTKRIVGFTGANIRAVDITDATRVTELSPAITAQPDGTYAADVQVSGAPLRRAHTVLVFVDGLAGHPENLRRNAPSSWWSKIAGADYVVISSREFMANVKPLVQLRRNQGMVVNVIDVEDLYDEFSYGVHSPNAIHDFLQTAAATWRRAPKYLLLAGDSSFDPKNYLEQGYTDFVPTKLLDTTLMETASDDWLADFDGDGVANLAVGRLPLRTSADADLIVGKILNYEKTAPDSQRGALLVADKDFEASSIATQNVLPPTLPLQVINRSSSDDSTIHGQIISGINQGPRLVNFVGHGGNGTWTGALILSNPDAPSLTNTNRLSVFVMMTCMNGYFQNAYIDSLSEALMRTPGGAVAVWASSGMTEPEGQALINQEFYRRLFSAPPASQPATLGDAARAAKQSTRDMDVRRTWLLFGDPAMRLK